MFWTATIAIAGANLVRQHYNNVKTRVGNSQYISSSSNIDISNGGGSGINATDTSRSRFGGGAGEVFAYPIDIDPAQDHVEISQYKYQRPGAQWGAKDAAWDRMNASAPGASTAGMKFEGSVILPMPTKVSDSNITQWGKSELTSDELIKAQAAGIALGAGQGGEDRRQERNAARSGARGDAPGGGATKGQSGRNLPTSLLLQGLSRRAADAIGGNANADALLARARGQILNPNAELLFQGPGLREFKFNWLMVARSSSEGRMIRAIIRKFKVGSAAKFNNVALLETPDIWHMKYKRGNQELDTANRFEQMALVNMTVDYAPEGYWTTYTDSQPVAVRLVLDFKELRPIFREHQETKAPSTSVGY